MGKKILVVDDEPDMTAMISELLGTHGFEVRIAADGQAALDAVAQEAPDLILMDIMLPKVDGWLVCQKLKTDEKFSKIPIILVSGILESDAEANSAVEKCDYLIAKPFKLEKLLQKVKEFTP